MSMRDLVPLARRLIDLTGDTEKALALVGELMRNGAVALGPIDDDLTRLVRDELRTLDVIDVQGEANSPIAAELMIVCDILTQVPERPRMGPPAGRMVYTAPQQSGPIPSERRLDLLVADVIRMATHEILIGSGFWNEAGVDSLLDVLRPAIVTRGVGTTVFAQYTNNRFAERLRSSTADLEATGQFGIEWYGGPANSLMHAKFVVADRNRGYLGTANLTSLGFSHHIEVGVELTGSQAKDLAAFLDELRKKGLFRDDPDESHQI